MGVTQFTLLVQGLSSTSLINAVLGSGKAAAFQEQLSPLTGDLYILQELLH